MASHTKELKKRSTNEQFRKRFEEEMQKIAESLNKKSGVKQVDKVHERIRWLKGKHPSIGRYFDIVVETTEDTAGVKTKSKSNKQGNQVVEKENKQIALALNDRHNRMLKLMQEVEFIFFAPP